MSLPLATILHTIAAQPRTPDELARLLGSTADALGGMLRTLRQGGYVQDAVPQEGSCACGPCSLKSMCRNADQTDPALHLLRLTPRGEAYLQQRRPT
ncbi:MarR family transcriptional regulator [Deinococcus multiflagellatus]|uniref:MarR family transcriptional regulator n=1 Tax=Deinococcus multiflagellatus TaxID=1656887 RepID=A0ABW1ZNM1_9DEIO|nr:MarR family transcriptional regulator [Deinococcus multiflagellatus]MBZ9713992.1 MarR family transcriptional regulator [Deinococcus multiflagellatus]